VKPVQVGVFSVEGEIEIGQQLVTLGITVFVEKRPGLRDTILLEMIDNLLAQNRAFQEVVDLSIPFDAIATIFIF
jgi:hypothetical protein